MGKPFLTDEAKKALTEAVQEVEASTSAELVVAIRARSGSYLHADLIAGIAVGLAALAFLEKRVHGTAGRTGFLLYVSVLEREAVVVTDLGLEALAATESWQQAIGAIEAGVREGEDGVRIAERVRALAHICGPALPRAHDDIDELANEVCG